MTTTSGAAGLPTFEERYSPAQSAEFYAKGYWLPTTLLDFFDGWVQRQPERQLVTDGVTSLTWREVDDRSRALAAWLRGRGVGHQDRVVVQLPNWSEIAIVVVAVARLGAILIPAQPVYRHSEMRHIISDSQAKAVLVPAEFRGFDHASMALELEKECPSLTTVLIARSSGGVADGATELSTVSSAGALAAVGRVRPAEPDDGYAILYSSGTTAKPKGCLHTWNTLGFTARAMAGNWEIDREDVAFVPSPVGHGTGLLCGVLIPLMTGSSTVLLDHWTPEAGIRMIAEHGCTWAVTAATFLTMVFDVYDPALHDLHSMRAWVMAGAPIPPSIVERTMAELPRCRVLSLYGRSENFTACMCRVGDPPERALTSDGRPLDGVEVVVVDADGRPLGRGELGDVSYRGPGHMLGYVNSRDQTARLFTADGFSRSGDLGRIDEHGYLRISGRSSDMIIRGGLNISATEVEENLVAHPRVREAAVVSMPDERLGERSCAYVVPVGPEPLELGELTSFLSQTRGLATPKLPERLELVAELPHNSTGKVLKAVLRERIRETLLVESGPTSSPR